MSPEEFEKKLKQRPMRQVPAEWRADILAVAKTTTVSNESPASVEKSSVFSVIQSKLSALLWPHPKAWAGLAAVWVVIAGLRMTEPGKPVRETAKIAPPTAVAVLTEQRRELAQLLGDYNDSEPVLAPHQLLPPRPRSERRTNAAAV